MITNIQLRQGLLVLVLFPILMACTPEPEPMPAPTSEDAAFSFSYDPDNPNRVLFSADTQVETWYTHWAFGDNTSAEGVSAEKTYPLSGDYEVRYKIFTEGGTAEQTLSVSITEDLLGPNLLLNEELEGDEHWTVLPITDGMEIAFEDGVATWNGGNWGHAGIYQAIQVEANTRYQINMDIVGSGMTDCWFEVYAGTTQPRPGEDYTDGGIRLGLNTWEGCGSEPFEGLLSTVACVGEDGTFEFPNDETIYLVIRGGGVDYGDGVSIDNVSVRAL